MPAVRRSPLVPLVLAAVVVAVTATAGSSASPTAHRAAVRDFPTFLFATIADDNMRGSVAAVQRTSAPTAGVFVSLHGLAPSSEYTGAIADVPCGRAATGKHKILDLLGVKKTAPGEDDFFENKSGRLGKRLARGVTVRIYRGGNEVACGRANRVR